MKCDLKATEMKNEYYQMPGLLQSAAMVQSSRSECNFKAYSYIYIYIYIYTNFVDQQPVCLNMCFCLKRTVLGHKDARTRGWGAISNRPRQQSSLGQHGAHLGPVGPRWAPWTSLSGVICFLNRKLALPALDSPEDIYRQGRRRQNLEQA